MRKPIVAGNWKLHKTPSETEAFIKELGPLVTNSPCEVVVAPTYTALDRAARALVGTKIGLGAQNVYWEPKGAFTGEVATSMLTDLCVKYVIIGHSERRQFFGETDETVNKRVKAALSAGLIPIVCVGETLAEREGGQTHDVVAKQVQGGLAGFTPAEVAGMIIAYEPVWAIGTGKVATKEQAQEVHAAIRQLLVKQFGDGTAAAVRIQYGGSVKPDNAAELLSQPDIDGALVGGAALVAKDFAAICNAAPTQKG